MKKSGCRCDKDGMNNGECAEEPGWGQEHARIIVLDGVRGREQGNGCNRFLGLYVLGLRAGVLFFCLPSALFSTENGIPLQALTDHGCYGKGRSSWLRSFWGGELSMGTHFLPLVLFVLLPSLLSFTTQHFFQELCIGLNMFLSCCSP